MLIGPSSAGDVWRTLAPSVHRPVAPRMRNPHAAQFTRHGHQLKPDERTVSPPHAEEVRSCVVPLAGVRRSLDLAIFLQARRAASDTGSDGFGKLDVQPGCCPTDRDQGRDGQEAATWPRRPLHPRTPARCGRSTRRAPANRRPITPEPRKPLRLSMCGAVHLDVATLGLPYGLGVSIPQTRGYMANGGDSATLWSRPPVRFRRHSGLGTA